jgi:hypothetical protein
MAPHWVCGGEVFCLDESGTTQVLKAGPEFKVLGADAVDEARSLHGMRLRPAPPPLTTARRWRAPLDASCQARED